jgi:hypothetical protein
MVFVWSDSNVLCLLWTFVKTHSHSSATRCSATVYVRTPSCGSTTNIASARASDRICQICFASASVHVKLTLSKSENEV